MSRRRMALLAKQGRAFFEKGRMIAAMRLVAQRAILRGRRVFPQVWSLLFCMAGEAGFVDSRLLQQEIVVAVVRVVTVTAGHVAKAQRVTAGFQDIGTAPGVAIETGLLLRQ